MEVFSLRQQRDAYIIGNNARRKAYLVILKDYCDLLVVDVTITFQPLPINPCTSTFFLVSIAT